MLAATLWFVSQKGTSAMAADDKPATMLVHDVYFTLQESTPENREKLLAACRKYLVDHPGVVLFACGTPADLDRPVNDRAWDVGLHVVFESRAAHDRYQTAPAHLKFIDENRSTWKQVRVFDTDAVAVKKN
jgi:hypothetical protein